MLALTEDAAKLIARAAQERSAEPRLRIRVVAGGCSGLTWDWSFCGGADHPGDLRKTTHGVTVVVDPASAPWVRGARIEVAPQKPPTVLPMAPLRAPLSPADGSTIRLANLPAKNRCGCAESFPAA